MFKTASGIVLGLIIALILIHIYKRYQQAQSKGQPFGLDDIIGTMNKTYSYELGKCYQTETNSVTENIRKEVVDDKMCYGLDSYISSLTSEYANLENQLASLPNPTDPNDTSNRAMWQARVNDIIKIFKTIKGCGENDSFDVANMICIKG